MKKQITFLLMMLASAATFGQHENHAGTPDSKVNAAPVFKDAKLGSAYAHYIQLKDALVASDAAKAQTSAKQLEKSLEKVAGSLKAKEEANKVSASNDLAQQRQAFSKLTTEMTILVKANTLSAGSLFLEFCPMANNHAGAYWLSNDKEIKNPSFGDKMLKCGSVKETIQ